MRSVAVTLNWLKPEEGGRTRPVQGASYATVVNFPTLDHPDLRRSAWSVVLEFTDESTINPATAVMRFLVPDAPHEILTEGLEFELREGSRIAAKGKVVETTSSSR